MPLLQLLRQMLRSSFLMVTDAKQAHIILDGERNVRNSFRVHAHLCNAIACVPLTIVRRVCLDNFFI